MTVRKVNDRQYVAKMPNVRACRAVARGWPVFFVGRLIGCPVPCAAALTPPPVSLTLSPCVLPTR